MGQDDNALVDENRRLRSALEASIAGLFVIDKDLNIRFVNSELLNMLQYDVDDVLGQSFAIFVDRLESQDEDFVAGLFARARAGEVIIEEMPLRRKDGDRIWIWVKISLITNKEGVFDGFVGAARNISKQKTAEAKLEATQGLLEESQNIAHLGSWSLDLGSDEAFWTKGLFKIFNLAPETYKPTKDLFFEFLHEEDRPIAEEKFRKAVEAGAPFLFSGRVKAEDEQERWIQAIGRVSRIAKDHPGVMQGVVQDITDVKKIERRLKERVEESERISRLLINRELKMRELKSKIKELRGE